MAIANYTKLTEIIVQETIKYLNENNKKYITFYTNSPIVRAIFKDIPRFDLGDESLYTTINPDNIIVGSILTKERIEFGLYKKYGPENTDFLPFGDLYWSEVIQLAKWVGGPEESNPYDMWEWASREEANTKIISNQEDPSKHANWGGYLKDQRENISEAYVTSRKNHHKKVIGKVLPIRNLTGIVR